MIFIISKVLKWILILLLLLLAAAKLIIFILRSVNSKKYKIDTENGIDESLYLQLGEIEQFIQIRGKDVSNPVIIFLHGGPGVPISYLSYYYQKNLISDYTFISWDQRSCGRTYYKNKDKQTKLTPQQLLTDLDELINYSKQRFNKEEVILIGQSWGSVLSMLYTLSHPENVSANIGVGQAVDFDAGKVFASKEAIKTAQRLGERADNIAVFEHVINDFSRSKTISEVDIDNSETMLTISQKYLPAKNQISGTKLDFIGITSPDINLTDLRWLLTVSNATRMFELQKSLVNYSFFEFDVYDICSSFNVPMYFIQGECDWITPTPMVQEYYETVSAPDKELVIMQGCGHTPFLDDPIEFADSVKTLLNRIEN